MSSHPTHDFALLLHRGDASALSNAVAYFAPTMEAAGEADLLRYWQGRAQLLEGNADAAAVSAAAIVDTHLADALKILALREKAKASRDASALLTFLDQRLAASDDAISLYESCEANLRFGKAVVAAARAEELARRVPTPAGLDIAVQSSIEAGDLAKVLRILEGAAGVFPEGELPVEYQRMRLQCEQQLGRVAKILPDAERLASKSGQLEDVAHLVQLQLKAADPKKAAVAARDLLRFGEARAQDLIPAARAVFPEDRQLSRSLLRKATEAKDLHLGMMPAAINLAGLLGEDEIISRLFPTMVDAAQTDGSWVRMLDPVAGQALFQAHRERFVQAGQLYEEGTMPLHSITGTFGRSMPAFIDAAFHPPVVEDGKWPTRPTVFIRHGARAAAVEPAEFSSIYLDISAVLIASELGLLDDLERVFSQLHLPPAVTGILLAELARVEATHGPRWAEVREKTNDLLARIRDGLQSGRWLYLPDPQPAEDDLIEDMESACLISLIQAPLTLGAVAWLDDRLLNSHGRCGAIPIVTVLGILRELRRRGAMEAPRFFDMLHRLRTAEMRYVPLETEEILHWLGRAQIKDHQIVETTELATLRRYVALCLGDRGRLQGAVNPSPNKEPAGEAEIVLSLYRSITEALPEVWRQDSPLATRVAQADWVLHELWFDPGAGAVALGVTLPASAALKSSGSSLSHLYSLGIPLILPTLSSGKDKSTDLDAFMAWLFRRTAHDKKSLDNAARWLVGLLDPPRYAKGRNEMERRLLFEMLQGAYFALPEPLRDRLKLSKRQRREIGVGRIDLLSFGGHSFEAQEYWLAVTAAIAGEPARVKAQGSDAEFDLQLVDNGDRLGFRHLAADGSVPFASADPVFLALRENPTEREAGLLNFPEWFEASGKSFARTVRKLARNGNIGQRMGAILAERKRSAAYRYREFQQLLKQGHTPQMDDFEPPPIASLVRHLRLPWPSPPQWVETDYEAAATTLLQEVRLEEALRRFTTLPVRLPDVLQVAVQTLDVGQKAEMLTRLREELVSPIAQIHLVGLFLTDDLSDRDHAVTIFRKLAGDFGEDAFDGFEAILQWVCHRFVERGEDESAPASAMLVAAWTHATRLHHFLEPISRKQQIANYFKEATQFLPGEAFCTRDELACDIAHPRSLHRSRLLLLGLAHALPATRNVKLPDALRQTARNTAFYSEGDARAPRIELCQPFHHYTNHLSSFLGASFGTSADRLLPLEDAAFFTPSEVDQTIEVALNGLNEAPASANQWLILATLLRQAPVQAEKLRDGLEQALLACKFTDFLQAESDVTRTILFFQAGRAATEPIRPHVRNGLIELAKSFAIEADAKRSVSERSELLLETAHQWAIAAANDENAAREMGDIVTELATFWPAFATETWRILRTIVFRLPPTQITELWTMISKLRAQTWRSGQQT